MFVLRGDASLAGELRQKTAKELSEHAKHYSRHSHINAAAAAMGCDTATIWQTLLDKPKNTSSPVSLIKDEGIYTKQNGRWCSMLHVFALSTVLDMPIYSLFPDVKLYAKPLYEGKVEPLRSNSSLLNLKPTKITILWSRLCMQDEPGTYIPDHVVPLIPK